MQPQGTKYGAAPPFWTVADAGICPASKNALSSWLNRAPSLVLPKSSQYKEPRAFLLTRIVWVLTESLPTYGPYFAGFESVPAARVAMAYQRSVEGGQTGRVYRVQ